MAEGSEIAKAYVQIIPTTDGISGDLTNIFGSQNDAIMGAGSSAGSSFLSGFGSVIGGIGELTIAAVAAGIGAVTALTGAVSNLAELGDEIDKNSQKIGVSASFYQEWDAVLQHSGTSMDAMTSTFKTLTKASQDMTEDQLNAFNQLGLTMQQVQGMSQEELFDTVIYNLQQMEEGTQRAYIAQTLLGRGAMELGPLLNTTAEETQAMKDAVNELGGVLSDTAIKDAAEFQDNLQDLQTAISGIANSMLIEFLPGFNETMEGLIGFLSGNEDGLAQVNEGIQTILTTIADNLDSFLNLAASIVEGLGTAIIENLPSLLQTGMSIIKELGGFILQNLPMLVETALQLMVTFANDISQAIPTLIPTIVNVVLKIIDTIIDNLGMVVDAAILLIVALADGIIAAMPQLMEKAPEIIGKLVSALVMETPQLLSCALDLMLGLAGGIIDATPELILMAPMIIKEFVKALADGIVNFEETGGQLIEGLWNGISNKTDWIIAKIKTFGSDVLQGMKDFFTIASPSKLMRDQVGRFIAEGVGVGIEEYADEAVSSAIDMSNDVLDAFDEMNGGIDNALKSDLNFNSNASLDVSSQDTNSMLMELLNQYLPMIADGRNVNVSLQGDADDFFTVMQEKNEIYKNQNGQTAFA